MESIIKLYRVRRSFDDIRSQAGAFFILENAINKAYKTRLNVYDENKNCVWSYKNNKKYNRRKTK
ncbi:MAG: hypothetical protein IJD55_04735 [Clostridia bacterium]|nr:hypothetical protein [Clostridia bacterium]